MLRKLFLFGLTVTYLISAGGVSVAAHFCGNNLKSISFYTHKAKSCLCSSKSKKKKGCCNSRQTFIKITAAHHLIPTEKPAVPKVVTCLFFEQASVTTQLYKGTKFHGESKAPPLSHTPTYIQNRLIRI